MSARRGDATALLRDLVRIDSRNPSLVASAPGEQRIASALTSTLRDWGIAAELVDASPGRPNVVAVVRGTGGGKSLMFNGHLDVVGVEGMTHAPFDGIEANGRLYGRGSSDMKGGIAAMCAAAARVQGKLRGDLIIAAVADEEWRSAGTTALLRNHVRADAAIVTEPTRLQLMPAHKGFTWYEVTVEGKAAHGSRWDLGEDAIRNAGVLLAELDRIDTEILPRRTHPLLGRASLHVGEIRGGTGISTYPDRCTFTVERRALPGEDAGDLDKDWKQLAQHLGERKPRVRWKYENTFSQPASDVALDAPIVVVLSKVLRERGLSDKPAGMSAWTDAALLNAAGIPAICFGPGDMGLAHAAEEYIELQEVEQAADVLESFARMWCT